MVLNITKANEITWEISADTETEGNAETLLSTGQHDGEEWGKSDKEDTAKG